ncbi:MAG: hypothetical protein NC347_14610 [Clostridium sp.]|nr:hypothetical protein [Clostridium sp.]
MKAKEIEDCLNEIISYHYARIAASEQTIEHSEKAIVNLKSALEIIKGAESEETARLD